MKKTLQITFFFLWILSFKANDEQLLEHITKIWLKGGKCKGLWRPDKLQGRCFGLKATAEYKELSNIKVVNNAAECKAICCNLGDKCVTWQFQKPNECQVGGAVRVGFEGAATVDWCEPFAPAKWNGKKLKLRSLIDGKLQCYWGEHIPNQCFGMGAERLNTTKGSLNTIDCEDTCCKDETCGMWQEIPGRGCYYSKQEGIWCDKPREPYEGGRKCIPNFCGGMEHQILSHYNKTHLQIID